MIPHLEQDMLRHMKIWSAHDGLKTSRNQATDMLVGDLEGHGRGFSPIWKLRIHDVFRRHADGGRIFKNNKIVLLAQKAAAKVYFCIIFGL